MILSILEQACRLHQTCFLRCDLLNVRGSCLRPSLWEDLNTQLVSAWYDSKLICFTQFLQEFPKNVVWKEGNWADERATFPSWKIHGRDIFWPETVAIKLGVKGASEKTSDATSMYPKRVALK